MKIIEDRSQDSRFPVSLQFVKVRLKLRKCLVAWKNVFRIPTIHLTDVTCIQVALAAHQSATREFLSCPASHCWCFQDLKENNGLITTNHHQNSAYKHLHSLKPLSLSLCRAWLLAVSQRRPLNVTLTAFVERARRELKGRTCCTCKLMQSICRGRNWKGYECNHPQNAGSNGRN